MARKKRSNDVAGLDKPNGSSASDRVLRKRPSTGPPANKDPTEAGIVAPNVSSPAAKSQRPREVPCVGCLVGLVSWMPEDGEPKFCYDTTGKLSVLSLPGRDPLSRRPDGQCSFLRAA